MNYLEYCETFKCTVVPVDTVMCTVGGHRCNQTGENVQKKMGRIQNQSDYQLFCSCQPETYSISSFHSGYVFFLKLRRNIHISNNVSTDMPGILYMLSVKLLNASISEKCCFKFSNRLKIKYLVFWTQTALAMVPAVTIETGWIWKQANLFKKKKDQKKCPKT